MKAAAGVLVVLLAAGCGSGTVAGKAIGNVPPTATSTSAPTAEAERTTQAPAESPEPDIDACFDGECELTVSEPVDVPVDPALGFGTLSVELTGPDSVRFQIQGDGTSGGGSISGGGRVRFDDVRIEVVRFSGDSVTLDLSRIG